MVKKTTLKKKQQSTRSYAIWKTNSNSPLPKRTYYRFLRQRKIDKEKDAVVEENLPVAEMEVDNEISSQEDTEDPSDNVYTFINTNIIEENEVTECPSSDPPEFEHVEEFFADEDEKLYEGNKYFYSYKTD